MTPAETDMERRVERLERDLASLLRENQEMRARIADHAILKNEIRESRDRVRLLMDAAPDCILLIDPGGKVLSANRRIADLLGMPIKALIGKNVFQAPPDRPLFRRHQERVGEALRSRQPVRFEDEQKGRIYDTAIHPVLDAAGNVAQLAIYARDITEQRTIESALRRRLGMEHLLSHISSSFLHAGSEGEGYGETIREALREIAQFLDVDRSSLVLFTPDLRSIDRAFVWQCMAGDTPSAGMSLDPYRWAVEALARNETVIVEKMADLPPEADPARQAWEATGVRSIMAIPLMIENRLAGMFGFCFLRREVAWSDQDLIILRIMGEMFSSLVVRWKTEKSLRESRHFIRRITASVPFLVHVFDLQTERPLYVNARLPDVFGFSETEIMAMDEKALRDLIHPDDVADLISRLAQLAYAADDRTVTHEFRARHKTRGWRWCRTWVVVFSRDETGRARQLLASVLDITDRVEILQALVESESRYRELVEGTDSLVARFDSHGIYTYVNHVARTIFGVAPEACIGRPAFRFVHPEDHAATLAAFEEWKRPKNGSISFENRLVSHTGQIRHMLWSIHPIRDEKGEVTGFSGIASDVTLLKETEKALIRARQRAEEAGRAKDEFLANMSHEIRTPISGIIGVTDMTLTYDLTPDARRNLTLIRNSARGLLSVINDILDYSKVGSGKMTFHPRVFDLRETLSSICAVFAVSTEEKGLSLYWEVAPEVDPLVFADPDRISQVLNNLLGNAVKFTEKGRVTLRVDLTGSLPPFQKLRFTVTDTGIGIPRERIQDLFRSFHQLESDYAKRYQGTGLGLYISKALVEKMGGDAGVRSEVGKGSRFHFDLPWGRVEATRAEAAEPMAAAHEGPALSILLAEDERLNRMHLVFGLESAGHRVAAVENGRAALATLESAAFDVVLMDIQMPEMDGVEATRRIRGAEGGDIDPSIPIIALSAYVTERDRESFAEAGVDAYVAKPVETTELLRVIHEVVGSNAASTGSLP